MNDLKLNNWQAKMSPTCIKLFLLFSVLSFCVLSEKLVCYSQSKLESETIYKHFYGVSDGFYVDISPSHPILDSSTIFVRSQGWSGVNLLTNSQKLREFSSARPEDMNIFLDAQTSLSGAATGTADQISQKKTFQQICHRYFYSQPQLLAISGQYLKFMIDSNDWTVQKCRPQLILIRQYQKEDANGESGFSLLKQKQYTQSNINGDFKIFIHTKYAQKYKQTVQKNNKLIPESGLIPFSSIISNLAFKVNNKDLYIKQIKGNVISPQIYVNFVKNNKNFDVRQVSKQAKSQNLNDQNVKNLLIMQFNPKTQHITLQAESYKAEIVTVANEQKFYHLTYYLSAKNPIEPNHVYIFDHEFVQTSENNLRVVALPPFQEQKIHFNSSEVDKYDISKIDQLKLRGENSTQVQQKGSTESQQKQRQIEKQKQVEQRRKQEQKRDEELKKKSLDTQRMKGGEQRKQEEEKPRITIRQNGTKIQIGNETKKNKTLPLKKKTYQEQKPKIQNLTPQNILWDQQIINKTIWILVLVFSILGSIIFTAAITACIMKRRHKAHVRSRIKHNQQNHHIEQSSQNQETEPKSTQINN